MKETECPRCGTAKGGAVNCCSGDGAWAGKCSMVAGEMEHTWTEAAKRARARVPATGTDARGVDQGWHGTPPLQGWRRCGVPGVAAVTTADVVRHEATGVVDTKRPTSRR